MKLRDQVAFTFQKRTRYGYICGIIKTDPMQYEVRYDFNPQLFRCTADDLRLVSAPELVAQ